MRNGREDSEQADLKNMAMVDGNRYGEHIFIPKVLDEVMTTLLIT